MAAVAADHKRGVNLDVAAGGFGAQPGDTAAVRDEIGRLRLHQQVKAWIALAMLGDKIEEVPLRHERDEFAVRRQVAEINHRDALGADLEREASDLLVWQLEEFIEQPELVHQLERRGM